MATFVLQAQKRSALRNQVKKLRLAKQIPATLYGRGLVSANLALDYVPFEKAVKRGAVGNLVDLNIASAAAFKALIQDIQYHPLTGRISHVDLWQVKMDEKIKTDIKLNFVGESPAVKGLGGIFIKSFGSVPAECLPGDLVSDISVDISALKAFGDVIHVSDIVVPAGIKILSHAADVIATVAAPRSEEEIAAAAAPVVEDVAAVKVETEEKKKEREAAAALASPTTGGAEKSGAKK